MSTRQTIQLPVIQAEESQFAQGSLFFIGTATVLLRYAGFTILTDPNFLHQGEYVHLGYGFKSRRLTRPALEIENLPPVDLVVLSHLHEDHFDRLVEKRLNKHIPIVTTPAAARTLRTKGFDQTYPLETWETLTVRRGANELDITALPGKHGPGVVARLLPPVMGSMLKFKMPQGTIAFRLYITGDTLVHSGLKTIAQRYPEIDLALFHLGGTKLLGLLLTMDAQQGVEALKIIRPQTLIPIHYNDYTVFRSSLEDFQQAVRASGLQQHICYLSHGETYLFEIAKEPLVLR